jgi:hypothetical protein
LAPKLLKIDLKSASRELEKKLLTEVQIKELLDPKKMTGQ